MHDTQLRRRVAVVARPLIVLQCLLLLACARDPMRSMLRRHQHAFPPAEGIADMPSAAWPRGIGQVEALAAHLAARKDDAVHVVVVEIGGSWCAPCVKSYPEFVAATRTHRENVQFAHVGVELADPGFDALKAYIALQWNSGVEPTFPAHVILDRRMSPLRPLLFGDLGAALTAAAEAATDGASADTERVISIGDEAAWASFLETIEPRVVTLDTRTMGDHAEQMEKQLGIRIVLDWRIASRVETFKGENFYLGALQTLRGPYPFLALPASASRPPTLVMWDVPSKKTPSVP